jgi:hypothetical protein
VNAAMFVESLQAKRIEQKDSLNSGDAPARAQRARL